MADIKLEDVFLSSALVRIVEQNKLQIDGDQIVEVVQKVKKWAGKVIDAENKNEALLEAYALIDEYQDNYESDVKRKLSCRKGCAFCCHIEVSLTDLEKDVIMEYVKEHGIKYNAKRLEEQLPHNEKSLPASDVSRCVFLGNDNTCNIYPVRPLSCRKYLVQNDPKFCNAKKYPSHGTKIHFHYKTEILASAIFTASKKIGTLAQIMLDKKIKKGVVIPLPDKKDDVDD